MGKGKGEREMDDLLLGILEARLLLKPGWSVRSAPRMNLPAHRRAA